MTTRPMVVPVWLTLLIALCATPQYARAEPGSPAKPGVVFVVEGAGGFDWLPAGADWAFARAKVPHEIRTFEWTHGRGKVIKDLKDTPHLLAKAYELAEEIRFLKAQDPERPVYLVGKSTGCFIVLSAAGQLPPASLERIILLSAAVSPAYDLRFALLATRKEVISFHSKHDWFVLGMGTRRFGTADGVYSSSAGLKGFIVPDDLSVEEAALYRRLVQVPWKPRLVWEGHLGMHFGNSSPLFLYEEIAPWLMPVGGD